MLTALHSKKGLQLFLGFVTGIIFGVFLHKGGATKYDVIVGQLLFEDFTVVKIMLSAAVTGMIGIYAMRTVGLVQLHPKPGSWGMSAIGGLIFGVGFATLGYCPGTIAGAVGNGYLDAAIGGVVGIIAGAGIYAAVYPRLKDGILKKGDFGTRTLPELMKVPTCVIVPIVAAALIFILLVLEHYGL
ncbi:MAG TPA: YeeE/YedE thiosulfate transporter family protein [Candidatus Krumholzibacterium sp.]|nr:YeeE/YedE thiosulfate transporter family protein [Candidatus Krumholzibacterium sp.]